MKSIGLRITEAQWLAHASAHASQVNAGISYRTLREMQGRMHDQGSKSRCFNSEELIRESMALLKKLAS